jgi:hypothetical protein
MENKIQIENIKEFMDFLTNTKLPEGMKIKHQPKLKPKVAFSVIWFLQEHMLVLPSKFEMCGSCDEIYDSHRGGYYLDDQYRLNGKVLPKRYWGFYCEGCAPNIDFILA